MRAYPVMIEDGVVWSLDGTPLPRRAHALLVVLPDASDVLGRPALQPFVEYLQALRCQPEAALDHLREEELNGLVHATRR